MLDTLKINYDRYLELTSHPFFAKAESVVQPANGEAVWEFFRTPDATTLLSAAVDHKNKTVGAIQIDSDRMPDDIKTAFGITSPAVQAPKPESERMSFGVYQALVNSPRFQEAFPITRKEEQGGELWTLHKTASSILNHEPSLVIKVVIADSADGSKIITRAHIDRNLLKAIAAVGLNLKAA